VNQDHPQVVEVWNLVFMEFNRKADKSLEKLPAQHVDTGMGFERLCMALQGKSSNYDTDVFTPLIAKVEELSGKKYTGILEDEKDIAIRVVVDHIRAVSFALQTDNSFKRRSRLCDQKNFKKRNFLFLQILRHERTFPL
jgi:alanyl-tRNA synthetase